MWTAGAEGEREKRNEEKKEGEFDSRLTGISWVQEGEKRSKQISREVEENGRRPGGIETLRNQDGDHMDLAQDGDHFLKQLQGGPAVLPSLDPGAPGEVCTLLGVRGGA